MASETLKSFLVRLGFSVDKSSLASFGAGLAKSTGKVAKFAVGLQAAYATLAAGVFKFAAAKTELLELARSAGVTVDEIEELIFVAEQTNASADSLTSSLAALSKSMSGATIGGGGLETFHRLGIAITDANGKLRNTSAVLAEVGDKIKGMERLKAEMYLEQLGIDKHLYSMLTQDVSGAKAAYREMYDAVGLNADEAAEKAAGFSAVMRALFSMLKMVGNAVSALFIDKMGSDAITLRRILQDNIAKIMPALKIIVDFIARSVRFFGTLFSRIIGWFGSLEGGTQKLIVGILALAAAWKILNLGFLLSPIGFIIAAFIALLAVIDDFMTWKDGGDSMIDWGPWADSIQTVIDVVSGLFDILFQLWNVVKNPLTKVFKALAKSSCSFFKHAFGFVASILKAVVALFVGNFSGAAKQIKNAFSHLLQWLSSFFSLLLTPIREITELIYQCFAGVFNGILSFLSGIWDKIIAGTQKVVGYIASAFSSSFGAIIDIVKSVIALFYGDFSGAIGFLQNAFDKVFERWAEIFAGAKKILTGIVDTVSDLFGFGDDNDEKKINLAAENVRHATQSPESVLGKPSASQIAGSTKSVAINNKTEITVSGANDPEATARAIGRRQDGFAADLVRHTQSSAW